MSEEIYPDLNEEEDISMYDTRDEHCGYLAEDGDNKKKIHALRWEVYVQDTEDLIKIELSVSVSHTKGERIVWTCVKDHTIQEKEQYKAIGLCGFDYKLFEEEEGGGVRQRLDVYNYLKHLIQLWPGDWVNQMSKMNEMVGMNNRLMMSRVEKRLVRPFTKARVLKIYWLHSIGIYLWEERKNLCSEAPNCFVKDPLTQLQRYFHGTTDLNKICCDLYRTNYCYACH